MLSFRLCFHVSSALKRGCAPCCLQRVEEPMFRCFCGEPAFSLTSGTPRNPGRKFFICHKAGIGRVSAASPCSIPYFVLTLLFSSQISVLLAQGCKLWIWEDVLMRFVDEMLEYCSASTHDCPHEQLSMAREALVISEQKLDRMRQEYDEM